MRVAFVSFVAVFLIGLAPQAEGETPMKEVESISGTTLAVIQAAIPKLEEHDLRVQDYRISVFEMESAFLVLFTDPKQPADQRGSSTALIGFEVEISKAGLQVVRANFMR
jgi:hypothetical protein